MSESASRALSPWRAAYWLRPLPQATCEAMAEKYAALARLEALPNGAEQDAAIRAAAERWPGCLRESQLAGPARCRERHAQATVGRERPEQPRAAWRDEGAAAMVLWADLHPLLADLLQWRRRGGRGEAAELLAAVRGGPAAARWPDDPALLERVGGARVRPRLAYAWLAAQAGIELPALQRLLFGRAGHWDVRAGDPPFVP